DSLRPQHPNDAETLNAGLDALPLEGEAAQEAPRSEPHRSDPAQVARSGTPLSSRSRLSRMYCRCPLARDRGRGLGELASWQRQSRFETQECWSAGASSE